MAGVAKMDDAIVAATGVISPDFFFYDLCRRCAGSWLRVSIYICILKTIPDPRGIDSPTNTESTKRTLFPSRRCLNE